jgi:hypothetical protein
MKPCCSADRLSIALVVWCWSQVCQLGGHPSLPQLLVSAFGWLRRCRRVQLLVEQHIDADASNCLATYCAVNFQQQADGFPQPYVRQVRWCCTCG